MEGGGERGEGEARGRGLGWGLVGVVVKGGDWEVDDVGEGGEGGVSEVACDVGGLGGGVAAEVVVVVVGGTEVEEENVV